MEIYNYLVKFFVCSTVPLDAQLKVSRDACHWSGQNGEILTSPSFFTCVKRTSSPYINQFQQPDSIIPNPANPQSLNRYSYVLNSPVRYNDPSGHMNCEDDGYCEEDRFGQQGYLDSYGISTDGLSYAERHEIGRAARDIGRRFSEIRGADESAAEAFRAVYTSGVSFVKSDEKCSNCWGETNELTITIYSNANVNLAGDYHTFLIHEMGHVFDNVMEDGVNANYRDRVGKGGWTPMPTGCAGFSAPEGDCIDDPDYIEQAADMFLGWVEGGFENSPDGRRRSNWSNMWIGTYVNQGPGSFPKDYGFGCDEDTGDGCEPSPYVP